MNAERKRWAELVDRETAEAPEAVRDDLVRSQRGDGRWRRWNGAGEEREQDRGGEHLRHGLAWRKSRARRNRLILRASR